MHFELVSSIDEIMCWLLCAIVDHERMMSVIAARGVRWTGLPHSPKTDVDHLIKDNCCTVWRPLKPQRERKKVVQIEPRASGLSSQHLPLSYDTHRHPPLSLPLLLLCSWVTIDEIMCWLLCAIVDHERMVSVITDYLWLDDLHRSSDCGGVPSIGLSVLINNCTQQSAHNLINSHSRAE